MTKWHDYEKPYNQSTVLSYLKEIARFLFCGWTQNVWSAEAVSDLHKCYNKSQFSKVKTEQIAELNGRQNVSGLI